MIAQICFIWSVSTTPFKSNRQLEAENAALRHQLVVLQRKVRGRIEFTNGDRLFFILLYRWFSSVLKAMMIVRPETVVRWHRAGFRRYWRWNDRIYGNVAQHRIRAMGIRDKPIAPASPWQNGFAERLIGSIRRECLDHLVVLNEAHLRRILQSYAEYYNEVRTHRSLDKDAPSFRAVQRAGTIVSQAIIGGLHHHYIRG